MKGIFLSFLWFLFIPQFIGTAIVHILERKLLGLLPLMGLFKRTKNHILGQDTGCTLESSVYFKSLKVQCLGRAVVSGGAEDALWNSEVLLTLFQPEADYVHHITASTLRFENLTTYLLGDMHKCYMIWVQMKSGLACTHSYGYILGVVHKLRT